MARKVSGLLREGPVPRKSRNLLPRNHVKRSAFQNKRLTIFTNGFSGPKDFRDFRETGPRPDFNNSATPSKGLLNSRNLLSILSNNVLELELELYFYLNTVNLSDKIIMIIKITIYFNLYKHDQKLKDKTEKNFCFT